MCFSTIKWSNERAELLPIEHPVPKTSDKIRKKLLVSAQSFLSVGSSLAQVDRPDHNPVCREAGCYGLLSFR